MNKLNYKTCDVITTIRISQKKFCITKLTYNTLNYFFSRKNILHKTKNIHTIKSLIGTEDMVVGPQITEFLITQIQNLCNAVDNNY